MNLYRIVSFGIVGGIVTSLLNFVNVINLNGEGILSFKSFHPLISSFMVGFFLMSITYIVYEEIGFRPFRRPFRSHKANSDSSVSSEQPNQIKLSNSKSNK